MRCDSAGSEVVRPAVVARIAGENSVEMTATVCVPEDRVQFRIIEFQSELMRARGQVFDIKEDGRFGSRQTTERAGGWRHGRSSGRPLAAIPRRVLEDIQSSNGLHSILGI